MQKNIEKISKANYLKAMLTGENRVVALFSREENDEVVDIKRFNKKEMIVTISNNVLIVTEKIGKKQVPIIVKKWNKVDIFRSELTFQNGIEYKDTEGNDWLYLRKLSTGAKSLNMKNGVGERLTFIFE